MNKSAVCIVLLLLSVFMLSSCSTSESELSNRLIVEGIGVDYDSGNYTVTLQTLDVSSSQGSDVSQSGQSVKIFSGDGRTVVQAAENASKPSGKKPLYSQNRIIVFGRGVADGRIPAVLDFFVREYASRINVPVSVAKGKASDILSADGGGEIGAKTVEKILENAVKNSECTSSPLYAAVNMFSEKTSSAVLPLLDIREGDEKGEKRVVPAGSAVFSERNLIEDISPGETKALLFMTDKAVNGLISFNDSSGIPVCLEIIKSDTSTAVSETGGRPHFGIRVKCAADILEYGVPDSIDSESIEDIRLCAERYICSMMRSLSVKMLDGCSCDIFRFGRMLGSHDAEALGKSVDGWGRYISSDDVSIVCDVTVRGTGENAPGSE